ncbi:MAG: hypothetical protein IH885_10965, partial [Myxococcales bacterium]|nr:hypothetical protein [Myxococcales bacterium]
LGYIVEAELHTRRRDYERAVYTYDRALGNAESLQKSGGSQAPARKVEILRYRWRLRFWNGDNESALNDLQTWFTSWLHHSKKTDLSDTATANDLWLAGPMQALVLASMGRFDEARKVAQIPATESPETVAALLASAAICILGR